MKRSLSAVYPTFAILLPAAVLLGRHGRQTVRPAPPSVATAVAVEAPLSGPADRAIEQVLPRELRLVVAEAGNEARYRVREQLARIEFPTDAVGATSAVTGTLVLGDDGSVRDGSKFVVDITGLKSDSDRRDGFIKRRTLQTDQYPKVEFVPTAVTGLATPAPSSGDMSLKVRGDLTVHGTTKPVTWDVTAKAEGGTYTGTAKTAFTFDDFGLTKPRVGAVLSVVDTIRLEYDFRLVPASAGGS